MTRLLKVNSGSEKNEFDCFELIGSRYNFPSPEYLLIKELCDNPASAYYVA